MISIQSVCRDGGKPPSTRSDRPLQRMLTINTGSSSFKAALYEMGQGETRLFPGAVEGIGLPARRLRFADAQGATLIDQEFNHPHHSAALAVVLAWLRRDHPELRPDAAGHRVGHDPRAPAHYP